jgi:hypothetical protein
MEHGERKGNGKMVIRTRKTQIPPLFDPHEFAARFRYALTEAGWDNHADAIRALERAIPGIEVTRGNFSNLMTSGKLPRADRLLTIVSVLGLDLKTLFPEAFDREGRTISRQTHAALFSRGYRVPAGLRGVLAAGPEIHRS